MKVPNILLHSTPNHFKHALISVTMAFISNTRLFLILKLAIKQKFTQKTLNGKRIITEHFQTIFVTLIFFCHLIITNLLQRKRTTKIFTSYHQLLRNITKKIYCTAICV